MDPGQRRRFDCGRLGMAALALALVTAGGRAWGEAPSAPAGTVERAAGLVKKRSFEQTAAMVPRLLSVDPADPRGKGKLALDLEPMGDVKGGGDGAAALGAG